MAQKDRFLTSLQKSRRFSVGVFLLCSVCPEPVLAPRSCFNRKRRCKKCVSAPVLEVERAGWTRRGASRGAPLHHKRSSFPQRFRCLSRACLGKYSISISVLNGAENIVFVSHRGESAWRDAIRTADVCLKVPTPATNITLMYKPKDLNRDWSPRFSTLRDKHGWVRAKTARNLNLETVFVIF